MRFAARFLKLPAHRILRENHHLNILAIALRSFFRDSFVT